MRRRHAQLREASATTPHEEARPDPRSGRDRRSTDGGCVVATGLQGALRTLDGRDGRGSDLGLHGGRVQGGPSGGAACGRDVVARGADARLSFPPALALNLPVRVSEEPKKLVVPLPINRPNFAECSFHALPVDKGIRKVRGCYTPAPLVSLEVIVVPFLLGGAGPYLAVHLF